MGNKAAKEPISWFLEEILLLQLKRLEILRPEKEKTHVFFELASPFLGIHLQKQSHMCTDIDIDEDVHSSIVYSSKIYKQHT